MATIISKNRYLPMACGPFETKSILLTTLGVCLVLVGATSSIVGQQRDASIKSPDFVCKNTGLINDERQEEIDPFSYDLAGRIIELAEATRSRLEIVKATEPEILNSYTFFFRQLEFAPYYNRKNELVDYEWKDAHSAWASAAHAGQMSELHSLFLNPLSDCGRPSTKKVVLNSSDLKIDENGLSLKLTVSKATKQRAVELSDSLRSLYQKKPERSRPLAVETVYANTSVKAESTQVRMVTQISRGELDTLISKQTTADGSIIMR